MFSPQCPPERSGISKRSSSKLYLLPSCVIVLHAILFPGVHLYLRLSVVVSDPSGHRHICFVSSRLFSRQLLAIYLLLPDVFPPQYVYFGSSFLLWFITSRLVEFRSFPSENTYSSYSQAFPFFSLGNLLLYCLSKNLPPKHRSHARLGLFRVVFSPMIPGFPYLPSSQVAKAGPLCRQPMSAGVRIVTISPPPRPPHLFLSVVQTSLFFNQRLLARRVRLCLGFVLRLSLVGPHCRPPFSPSSEGMWPFGAPPGRPRCTADCRTFSDQRWLF